MPTIPSTTLTELEAALRVVIDGMTPTLAVERAAGWVFAEDRRMPAPSMVPRLYSFLWGEASVVPGGATGNRDTEVGCELSIVTDYRAFRAEDLGLIVESDFWDLHDRLFDAMTNDEITGFTFLAPLKSVPTDAQRVEHTFTVQYMRARRT
jgi:hypothetical protein